jgi:lipoprotein NlpI
MRKSVLLLAFVAIGVGGYVLCADGDSLTEAKNALKEHKLEQALKLASAAVEADPRNAEAYLLRGTIHEGLRHHEKAIADFDKTIALDPKAAEAYDHRGSEHLKSGHFTQSINDFDKFLTFEPQKEPGHWRRGIAYYYAGEFDKGRKQFEGYDTVDNNDVENAVWRYLCMARSVGVDKARAGMMKIGNDRRVPMMQVYALYFGRAKPEDVLLAANADRPPAVQLRRNLFYAHLYLGLYYEAAGDKKLAAEHIKKAANDFKIGDYMWDVAVVHKDLLDKHGR